MAASSDALVKLKLIGAAEFRSDAEKAERGLKGVSSAVGAVDRHMSSAGPQRYSRSLTHVSREARGAERSMRALGRARDGLSLAGAGVAGAAIGGFYALGRGVAFAGGEYAESRKVVAQTNAVITSTGGAAGITAKHVDSLATSLSNKTAIDDEQIASSENLLLTFSKIKKQGGIFDRATASALDLSAAGFGSVASTSKQLGKALNDPVKGMTALSKSGVTFTADQAKVIKSLVATGNTLGAQKKIMAAVEFQVKGSAAATATPLGHLKTNIANVAEQLGYLGAPVANKGISALADLSGRINTIAGRKDLSLEDKLKLTAGSARRIFAPLVDDAGREIRRMHLGTKLSNAVEWATPKIADAMATAAPQAAKAFITAFKESGPWGKVLTSAFLVSKMSPAFSLAGPLLMRRFIKKQVAVLAETTALSTGAATAATGAGTKFSSVFSTTAATGVGAAAASNGKLGLAFATLGRLAGPIAAAAFVVTFHEQLSKALLKPLDLDSSNQLAVRAAKAAAAYKAAIPSESLLQTAGGRAKAAPVLVPSPKASPPSVGRNRVGFALARTTAVPAARWVRPSVRTTAPTRAASMAEITVPVKFDIEVKSKDSDAVVHRQVVRHEIRLAGQS